MATNKSISGIFPILLSVAIMLAVLFGSAAFPSPVYATGITVNTTTDESNTGANCSLREAITAANADAAYGGCTTGSGADTITFSVSGTFTLLSLLPNITGAPGLTIDGAGQTVTISGNDEWRVMAVDPGALLTLNNLTIANGNNFGLSGGGIFNSGTLNITNSAFSGNGATAAGGIYNSGTLNVTNSAFIGNSATGNNGGGIYNSGTLNVTNSTFAGNGAGVNNGGGIYENAGTASITNSTFSGNSASSGGGIYRTGAAAVTLSNTIIVNSASGGNCSGTITNGGNNIDDGTTCGWGSTNGSMSSTDPLLGSLANNGGLAQSFKLLAGSPAIDGVTFSAPNGAPATDQRGVARPQGVGYDIGAFESTVQTGPALLVNASADTNDSSCDILGQGVGNKDCTLREAITAANALAGANTITFSFSGPIVVVGSSLPFISDAAGLTIDGTGHVVAIDGNHAVQVAGVAQGATLSLNNLTIENGSSATDAGAIYNNAGTINITNSTFSGNSATSMSWGGGIYNFTGTVNITNSTFSGNSATGGQGGAVFTFNGTLTITNSTFSGNSATDGAGGGLLIHDGTTGITNSTFSGNSATNGGGIYNNGSPVTLRNTIVANSPSGGNCNGPITNGGNNIDDGITCGWGSTNGSMSSTDPLLGFLTNNGGLAQSFALLAGSPAIDGVTFSAPNGAPATDQRGVARPQGGGYDIGAFEFAVTTINAYVGGDLQGSYLLGPGESMRVNYADVDSGPVVVHGTTTGVNIISAIRDAWSVNGVTTSFSQLMGLPLGQVSDKYVFPGYNNVTLNEQLRIGNVDTVPSNVAVTIGGVPLATYFLQPNEAVRINYAGLDSGPVVVQGTAGVDIISAIREAWAVNGVTKSFVQLMGLPATQLSDKYVFPAYNNVTLNEQLRIGNVDTVPSTVTVTIGGVLKGTYILQPNAAVRVNYAGLDSGPVVVQGTPGVDIISAIREAWAVNGVTTSFSQLMGMPATQLSDQYVFPAYNNVTLNDQLRIGNVDTVPSTITVTIAGVFQDSYTLQANEAVRVNYAGVDSGPVVVQGTAGVHIISAIREAWAVNGVTQSFVQLMGLPFGQLSGTYLFPAYNNVTLNEQLRIGVP